MLTQIAPKSVLPVDHIFAFSVEEEMEVVRQMIRLFSWGWGVLA